MKPLWLSLALACTALPAAADTCEFAGASFSTGAELCGCPQLFQQSDSFAVQQKTFVCHADGTWKNITLDGTTVDNCAFLYGIATRDEALTVYQDLTAQSCPALITE